MPSTGKQTSHSNTTSNEILFPLSIIPLEYVIILDELGLI